MRVPTHTITAVQGLVFFGDQVAGDRGGDDAEYPFVEGVGEEDFMDVEGEGCEA